MIVKTLTCVTVHGDADEAARRVWHEANEAAVAENARRAGQAHAARPLICDVTAIFKADDGSRLELRALDWVVAARLKEGAQASIVMEG